MESCKLFIGRKVTAPPGKAIRFFKERTTKPSRGSLSPSLLGRRRSPSLFFLSEPEKRERRWYFCHYLNIISGCRNLYLRCFGVTQPPHRNTPATIFAVTSDLASISALPFSSFAILIVKRFQLSITIIAAFKIYLILSWTLCLSAAFDRYCCKSMMLHERSSQEESLYSTGLSFFTPEMISDLRYLRHPREIQAVDRGGPMSSLPLTMYIAQVASNGRVLTWGAKIIVKLHPTLEGDFDAVLKFSGSVLLDEFQKAVTGMEGADVLSSVKMF
ncbi:hypothetical protein YC2023_013145 [Brassica napus]